MNLATPPTIVPPNESVSASVISDSTELPSAWCQRNGIEFQFPTMTRPSAEIAAAAPGSVALTPAGTGASSATPAGPHLAGTEFPPESFAEPAIHWPSVFAANTSPSVVPVGSGRFVHPDAFVQ